MEEARDRLFDLGSENISDGLPFLQLGFIKEDTEQESVFKGGMVSSESGASVCGETVSDGGPKEVQLMDGGGGRDVYDDGRFFIPGFYEVQKKLVGMNGKKVASFITGTSIENPGADPGEVLKAIYKRKDRGAVICFDEIEKADRECKEACGIPTDITTNKGFTDTFLDFPTPTNECIFVATVNRTEDVPPFIADRFAIRIEVLPLPYEERLEVIRVILQSFLQREGVDDKCPYARDKRNEHKVNCMCFTQNLDMVPDTKQKFTEYCQGLNGQVANLIESYRAYFTGNIYPLLNKPEGDKTLLFRQVEGFKDLLRQLNTQPMFLTDREDELFASDSEKMLEGRINYSLAMRMEEARDRLFDLGSENISDGLPFLQLGKIKEDTEAGLVIACQNRKGFNLQSPYLRVVWFHQKVVRVYVVKGFRMVDPRKLYVEVKLEED
ncbi:16285_t:CDS:2 [Funneliformis geosporum]|uniref:16285_t:CDS:1 n=1 Tax=Funneliformis geosporum TaxID=1117311 RepID=A0A9W4SYD9_9GLOM|nr:16285_t:CDS:2 [Funneliformis geosporum]